MTSERSAADIYGRDFPAGAVIFEEGDPGSRLFVIQAGVVRIEKRTGGRALTLARLGPGEFFGEMALLERQPRSATAVVDEAARILELDEGAFEQVVAERSEVALRLLARLSRRLRQANRQIRDFLSADATCRAVALLRALAGPPGEDGFRPIPAELDAARLAERSGAPLDGAALVARLQRARLLSMPSFPVTPTLLPLPLPTRYHLWFGEPMRFTGSPDDDDAELERKVAEVQAAVQALLERGLAERTSVFL